MTAGEERMRDAAKVAVEAGAVAELAGPHDAMGSDEIRRRAAAGAATLGLRSVLVLAMGLIGNLVLARLLAPRDFGLVALGTTLILVGRFFSDGGLGVALIGRRRPPEHAELEAVFGLQLLLSCAAAAVFAAGALPFGRAGAVPALMVASIPLVSFRVPASILLERDLRYRTIATVDVIEALTNYAWAIALVALGAGVWGLASAAVARALAGSVAMVWLGPLGVPRPRLSWRRVRPLLRFGLSVQGSAGTGLARDQGLNAGIAAISGVATLGIWSLTWRIMQAPLAVFASLWRVSYPAMSRLIAAGEDPRPAIERGIGVAAVPTAVLVVGIVGAAPALIPAVLGERWAAVPSVLLWSGLALAIATPVSVATLGYLFARGQGRVVLFDAVAQAIAWLAVALPLLPTFGATAVGLGWTAAAIVEATILGVATARDSGARILVNALPPLAIAIAAGAAGWAVSSAGGRSVFVGLAGTAVGEAFLLCGLALAPGDLLARTIRMVRTAVVAARTG